VRAASSLRAHTSIGAENCPDGRAILTLHLARNVAPLSPEPSSEAKQRRGDERLYCGVCIAESVFENPIGAMFELLEDKLQLGPIVRENCHCQRGNGQPIFCEMIQIEVNRHWPPHQLWHRERDDDARELVLAFRC
jgi:hypothetical protein